MNIKVLFNSILLLPIFIFSIKKSYAGPDACNYEVVTQASRFALDSLAAKKIVQQNVENPKLTQTERDLINSKILKDKTQKMKEANGIQGQNDPELLTLENGMRGVWKPSGYKINSQGKQIKDEYFIPGAEIAAYDTAKMIGFREVPETISRDFRGREGTLQRFIEGTDEGVALTHFPEQRAWFDYLIKNDDRHGANYLTQNGQVILIDNGSAFYPKQSIIGADGVVANAQISKKHLLFDELIDKKQKQLQDIKEKINALSAAEKANHSTSKQIKLEQKQLQETYVKLLNEIKTVLPEKNVYEKIKSTPDAEWYAVFDGKLSSDQLIEFFARKRKMVKKIEQLRATNASDEIFADAIHSPLVRQEVKAKPQLKNNDKTNSNEK